MFKVLLYIDTIYKERSFSKAAQKLHLAQPSLSLTIKKFEQDIGIQIFDRSVTPIQLTDVGEVYLKGVQQILSLKSDLEAYIDDYNELKQGSLVLGAAHLMASYLLPPFIARFHELYPHVEIRLVEGDFNRLYEMQLDGKIDLVIDSNRFDEELFCSTQLYCEYILLAVPNNNEKNEGLREYHLNVEDVYADVHLCDACPAVDLEEFRDQKFLFLEKGHDMRERGKHLCRERGFEPSISMELNQLMTMYNLADRQLGVAFVTDTIVKLGRHGKNISFYKINSEHAMRNISLAYKRSRYLSRAMNAFIALAKDISLEGLSYLAKF